MNGINKRLIMVCGHTLCNAFEAVALAGSQPTAHPPGNGDGFPGDVRRVFRAQECDHPANFLGLPDSVGWGGGKVR